MRSWKSWLRSGPGWQPRESRCPPAWLCWNEGVSGVREPNKTKYKTYELLSLLSGLVGGAVAGAVFTRLWRAVSGAGAVPEPTELDRRIRDVVVVGALQGAVFGVVKVVLSRLTAQGYRAVTGHDVKR